MGKQEKLAIADSSVQIKSMTPNTARVNTMRACVPLLRGALVTLATVLLVIGCSDSSAIRPSAKGQQAPLSASKRAIKDSTAGGGCWDWWTNDPDGSGELIYGGGDDSGCDDGSSSSGGGSGVGSGSGSGGVTKPISIPSTPPIAAGAQLKIIGRVKAHIGTTSIGLPVPGTEACAYWVSRIYAEAGIFPGIFRSVPQIYRYMLAHPSQFKNLGPHPELAVPGDIAIQDGMDTANIDNLSSPAFGHIGIVVSSTGSLTSGDSIASNSTHNQMFMVNFQNLNFGLPASMPAIFFHPVSSP